MRERSLVIVKPDGVTRQLVGRIISRFEDAGLKIVGMKMMWVDEKFAKKHYSDVAERRGEVVLQKLLKGITSGPVIAFVLEGLHSIEIIRKLVGETQPLKALPGTIRGDFAQHSYAYADNAGVAVANVIHASSSADDAKKEVELWFSKSELYDYQTAHEPHVM
ncbi:MAG TPA: nucleoside-diphosphate kinase [Candidatus Nanoarchaeia archaeon]|nr:nucleoside-diphosphate kinase [Candidatus Nanoarchaeia archaeon]